MGFEALPSETNLFITKEYIILFSICYVVVKILAKNASHNLIGISNNIMDNFAWFGVDLAFINFLVVLNLYRIHSYTSGKVVITVSLLIINLGLHWYLYTLYCKRKIEFSGSKSYPKSKFMLRSGVNITASHLIGYSSLYLLYEFF